MTQLLAAFLPQTAMWLFAAFFVVLFLVCLWRYAPLCSYACLAMCVVCAALLLRMGYVRLWMQPMLVLADTRGAATATVLETSPGYTGDTVRATLRVTDYDKAGFSHSFKVTANAFPGAVMGQQVRFMTSFAPLEQDSYLFAHYAKNVYLAATDVTDCEWLEDSQSPEITGKRIRENISAGICRYWPGDVGAIASAMAIGDKSRLTDDIKSSFRSTGISHALVVSGLHLGIVCSFSYELLHFFVRRKWAALGGIVAAVLFAAVTGFTPSIVRSGLAVLLYYGAQVCSRQSDTLTSLGFAALVMCMMNPYAAVDISTLLSFSATLGVLLAGAFTEQQFEAQTAEGKADELAEDAIQDRVRARLRFWCRRLLNAVAVPVATTLTTLPVLAAAGIGVSLVGVLCNLLAVPLLGIIVTGGLILGCWNGSIWLEPIARTAGLCCGICTRLLYAIAQWAYKLPWAVVHVSGVPAVLTILGAAALFYTGKRLRFSLRRNIALATLFVLLCAVLYAGLDRDIVRVAVIGGSKEPALVVTKQLHTAVVFRGREGNVAAVQDYLEQYNRDTVDIVVDLRRTGDTATLAQQLCARESVQAEALINHAAFVPFRGIIITVNHQKGGNYASVDCGGFTVGTSCGRVDLAAYPTSNVYLAGRSEPYHMNCKILLMPGSTPAWLQNSTSLSMQRRRVQQELCLVIRQNQSIVWRGAELDFS
ncbi:MAG: ComEC/Rec2 family competence protein [Ruthenibacterium sp.]